MESWGEIVTYIWQRAEWPNLTWDSDAVDRNAYDYALDASRLVGEVEHLPETDRTDALVDLMAAEAVKTSQIEGEFYDREDVRSSIRNQLGLGLSPEVVRNPMANGVAELVVSVREHFAKPLTGERLCEWQDRIVVGHHARRVLDVGMWRTGPVQVISGAAGKEKVHYEAPPSERVPAEMERFVDWFNGSHDLMGAVRAGVAHLYFECIHPFSDGNGRVGRAISDVALSQELGHPALLSLSTTIEAGGGDYYDALGRGSRGGMDITEWLVWFTGMVRASQVQARDRIAYVLSKARFWDLHADRLNGRQTRILERMFREGPDGFKGGMGAQKYAKTARCSKATATRDLAGLLEMGAFRRLGGGGRSTRYDIRLPSA